MHSGQVFISTGYSPGSAFSGQLLDCITGVHISVILHSLPANPSDTLYIHGPVLNEYAFLSGNIQPAQDIGVGGWVGFGNPYFKREDNCVEKIIVDPFLNLFPSVDPGITQYAELVSSFYT